MLERARHLQTILGLLSASPVVAILGPRQVGKSTLAREIAATWKRGPVTYLDLESDADLRRLAEPSYALEPLRGLVILDEVQRRPELFPSLRVLADRPKRPARFLVLGSASPHLLKQTSETLAGRIAFYELPGLSLEGVPVAAPRPRVRARRPRRPVVTSASAPSREVSSGKHADTRTPFP
jgi:predicted AAA+ superfamily ATPase